MHVTTDLGGTLQDAGDITINIAEDLRDNHLITRPTPEGGAGFDSQWDARFVHPIRAAIIAADDQQRLRHVGQLQGRRRIHDPMRGQVERRDLAGTRTGGHDGQRNCGRGVSVPGSCGCRHQATALCDREVGDEPGRPDRVRRRGKSVDLVARRPALFSRAAKWARGNAVLLSAIATTLMQSEDLMRSRRDQRALKTERVLLRNH